MKRILLNLLLPGALGLLLLASCQLFAQDERVDFDLPAWPEYLPELLGWQVQVHGAADEAFSRTLRSDAKKISLCLDKNRPCSIIISPLTKNHFFKPAGTIYPYSQNITWSGGYACQLYRALTQASAFNWEKFLQYLEEKEAACFQDQSAQIPFYNPWLLDSQAILEGIIFNNFTATKLKAGKRVCLPLEFEVFSSYVPENDYLRVKEGQGITLSLNNPQLFALREPEDFGLIICASSAKNISLDLISMPIFKEDL